LKIRGIRIESAEIETVMMEIPAIREAVVVAEENEHGEKQLAAYIVAAEGYKIDVNEIVKHLHERLPEYMIPSSFICLDSLPLTLTGKIDRRLMKSSAGVKLENTLKYEAPRNEIEEKLAEILKEVLKLERVGINDSFFTLGGDSLKAMQLGLLINKTFNVNIAINSIVEYPNIKTMASIIQISVYTSKKENIDIGADDVVEII
jgi:acyl carrier protein